MGVDPKRPLVGFALAAVLCAVLMALSVGRGSASLDVLHPGRPIAAPAERTPVEPPAEAPAVAAAVSIPAELSPQPIGVAVTSVRAKRTTSATAAVGSETDDVQKAPEKATEKATAKAARKADRAAERVARKARREADRAEKAAEKAVEKAARAADKLARAAVKAARKG